MAPTGTHDPCRIADCPKTVISQRSQAVGAYAREEIAGIRLTFPTVHGILRMDVIPQAGHILKPRFSSHRQDLPAVKLWRRVLDLRHLQLRKRCQYVGACGEDTRTD